VIPIIVIETKPNQKQIYTILERKWNPKCDTDTKTHGYYTVSQKKQDTKLLACQ